MKTATGFQLVAICLVKIKKAIKNVQICKK